MRKLKTETAAERSASDNGALFGFSVFDGAWYVGTWGELKKIGVADPRQPSMSKGHLFASDYLEYFSEGGEIYAAPLANPIDTDGYRQGARWECSDTPLRRDMLRDLLGLA